MIDFLLSCGARINGHREERPLVCAAQSENIPMLRGLLAAWTHTWLNLAQQLSHADSEVKLETQGMQCNACSHWIVCQHSGHCALKFEGVVLLLRSSLSNSSDISFSPLAVPLQSLERKPKQMP